MSNPLVHGSQGLVHLLQKILILSLLALTSLGFVSCAPDEPSVQLTGPWSIKGAVSVPISMPGEYDLGDGGMYSLETEFFLPEVLENPGEVWLNMGRPEFPFELYVNGHFLFRRGNLPYDTSFFNGAASSNIFLPQVVLNDWGNSNTLEIRLSTPTGRVRFLNWPALTGPKLALFHNTVVQFLNTYLFLVFSGISMVGGIYFLTLWLGKRDLRERLYFALSAISMGLYFLEFGSPTPLLNSPWYFPFMKATLFWSIGFLMGFFLEFYRIHNYTWLKVFLLALFTSAGLYVFMTPGDYLLTLDRFTEMLLPLELSIVFSLYLLLRSLAQRNPDAPPVFVGTILGVAFATHDVIAQVSGVIPLVWLQGLGFFVLEGSMFLSLAIHSTRMYRTLEIFSGELVLQKDELVRTNRAFARFVPTEFLGFLGKNSVVDVKLGDQVQQKMTILFSDIRNFTTLSEQMTPRENFALINSYLNKMAPVVREGGGIIDKYIGDAIMALYPGEPKSAIDCAIKMRNRLKDYNEGRLRAGYTAIDMGVGIHSGVLMLGTIGEEHRMESTVISDAVNTASRLESLTKTFGVSIMVSQATIDLDPSLLETYEMRYLGSVPLKGRSVGLGVYEVLHEADDDYSRKLIFRDLLHATVQKWEGNGRAGGVELFAQYKKEFPDDPILNFYLGQEHIKFLV